MTTCSSLGSAWRALPCATLGTLILTALGACGGGSGASSASVVGQHAVAASVRSLAAGAGCANGGIVVDTGIDTDGNGVLDPDEVTGTQDVCHGAAGADGLSSLVSIGNEAAGGNCAGGGTRIDAGKDANGDGTLDAGEIGSTRYICNGAAGAAGANGANGANGRDGRDGSDGTDGTNGSNGFNTLMSLTSEPVGGYCTYGGQRLQAGLDNNPVNGTLDAVEVTTTTYVCNGAGVNWVHVTGTAQQAVSNTGYIADNAAQVTITLPLSPAVGDIVEVSGSGAGGWRIAQNAGQSIVTQHVLGSIGTVWSAHGAVRNWMSVASSADGRKLVAAQASAGQLYTSADSGQTWTARGPTANWSAVASSADGGNLVAAVAGGQIFTSTDSGETWTARGPTLNWHAVASSADGSRLVAAVSGGQLYTSADSGVSWTARASARSWMSVASSADGRNLVAAPYGDQLQTSADFGVTWTAGGPARPWQSVASSADGRKLVASGAMSPFPGQIYTSIDAGSTWTARGPFGYWGSVASSADGSKLVVTAASTLYLSTDSGATWTARHSAGTWKAVASSADGTLLAAAEWFGQIHTSMPTLTPRTSVGVAGSISGEQYDAIELQYIGNDTFTVRNHSGYLSVQ